MESMALIAEISGVHRKKKNEVCNVRASQEHISSVGVWIPQIQKKKSTRMLKIKTEKLQILKDICGRPGKVNRWKEFALGQLMVVLHSLCEKDD